MEDTTIEDLLQTVEKFYAQKDYANALKTLESGKGKISQGLWHYNMGTVYGKLGDWPMARYHLLEALEDGYSDQPVLINKSLVEEKLGVVKLEKPLSVIDHAVNAGLGASHGILTSVSLLLLIFGLVIYFKKSSFKLFICLLLFSSSALLLNWWITSWNKSVVITAQSIHEGPSSIFGSRSELPPGIFIVTKKNGEWLKIIYPSRFQGWIKNAGLKEL